MAKEVFHCDECDNGGTITYHQNDTRFPVVAQFCPFCGGDLGDKLEESDEFEEDDY